jgi:transposase
VATVARMFDIPPQTLQYWYKNFLSDYLSDIKAKKWHPQKIETVNKITGEVSEKPVYVFENENIGENMSIDDKYIGRDGFTVLSNQDTSKVALLVESTNYEEVTRSMELFGNELCKIKNISMDMSPTYALVFRNLTPDATQIIDKFHVMKYVYGAVSEVRTNIRKDLTISLSKGKTKTDADKQTLSDLERMRRVRHAITQSPEKWSKEMENTVNQVFETHNELKMAYQISQNFKHWYDYQNRLIPINKIRQNLYRWYEQASQLAEFKRVIKMIRKHEDQILNFFKHGHTNAKAERLNGKIQRFVSANYGIKDKDFALYRIANYFK